MGGILRQPESALDAAGLGADQIAGDTGDFRVVERLHQDLVVGSSSRKRCSPRRRICLVGQHRADHQCPPAAGQGASKGLKMSHGLSCWPPSEGMPKRR